MSFTGTTEGKERSREEECRQEGDGEGEEEGGRGGGCQFIVIIKDTDLGKVCGRQFHQMLSANTSVCVHSKLAA